MTITISIGCAVASTNKSEQIQNSLLISKVTENKNILKVLPEPSKNTSPNKRSSDNKKFSNEKSKNLAETSIKQDPNLNEIKKIVSAYQASSGLEMVVHKEVYIDYTEETKKGEGRLYFSKSRLRLEMNHPDKYLLLLNKDTIWMENHLPKELGGLQISKLQASNKVKESNALLAFLFDKANVWDGFELTKPAQKEKSKLKLTIRPQKGQDLGDIVIMDLEIDTAKKHLQKISYLDSLDNRTTYLFSNIQEKKKMKDQLFNYTPPKGVPVTEI